MLPEIKHPQRPFAGRVSLRICDGFRRLDCTRRTDCEEHGLGLALVDVERCTARERIRLVSRSFVERSVDTSAEYAHRSRLYQV